MAKTKEVTTKRPNPPGQAQRESRQTQSESAFPDPLGESPAYVQNQQRFMLVHSCVENAFEREVDKLLRSGYKLHGETKVVIDGRGVTQFYQALEFVW